MEQEVQNQVIYSPSAVLHLFNNSISLPQTRRIIQLKGIFRPGKGVLYSGFYYDSLRDESTDAQITIAVPALIRAEMQPNKTATLNGFITKRVVNNASRIDIQLTVTDLVAQTQNKYAEEDLKRIALLQRKAAAGYRDVQSWIKKKIIREEVFQIGVIIGKSAIIDNDIKHQLRESIAFYNLSFRRINLSSEREITTTLGAMNEEGFDVIVISRGGGENLDIFNKPGIAEASLELSSLFVTAIGHKDDVTLLQQVADKAFITPSEFGQFLNDTFNHTVEEVQHSRAQLVESVKAQLTANYQKQIDNLNEKLKTLEELKQKSTEDLEKVYREKIAALSGQIELANRNYEQQKNESQRLQQEKANFFGQQLREKETQLSAMKAQLAELEGKGSFSWAAIIIGIIIGVILGLVLKGN